MKYAPSVPAGACFVGYFSKKWVTVLQVNEFRPHMSWWLGFISGAPLARALRFCLDSACIHVHASIDSSVHWHIRKINLNAFALSTSNFSHTHSSTIREGTWFAGSPGQVPGAGAYFEIQGQHSPKRSLVVPAVRGALTLSRCIQFVFDPC